MFFSCSVFSIELCVYLHLCGMSTYCKTAFGLKTGISRRNLKKAVYVQSQLHSVVQTAICEEVAGVTCRWDWNWGSGTGTQRRIQSCQV